MTARSGLTFTYRNGEEADHAPILESLGGGVALIDYDRDGWLDVFLPGGGSFDGPDKKTIKGHSNRLFRNLGGWKFRDVTVEVGLPAEGPFYSHGAAVTDHDNDGWPDLFVAHYVNWSFRNYPTCEGHDKKPDVCAPRRFDSLPHALYFNQSGKGFAPQAGAGFKPGPGLGVLLTDLDGDGRIDVIVNHTNEPVALLRNVFEPPTRWLGVALVGKAPRDSVEAALALTQGDHRQVQAVKGGGSYLSTSDPRVVFALAGDGSYRLTVRWPSGREQSWDGTALGHDRCVVLREGEDQPRPYPEPANGVGR